MRCIALHWLAGRKRLALLLALYLITPAAFGSTQPRYGGVLRVEMHSASANLDPREWKRGSRGSGAEARLASLIYDRLVSLDNYGRFVPQLATAWSHDAAFRRWQFVLRAGVKFSDGTLFAAADAVAAFAPLVPEGMQVSSAGGNLVFLAAEPRPDLLEVLASGTFFIYRIQLNGTSIGTGAFVVEENPVSSKLPPAAGPASAAAMQHLRFRANEECWAGRPFVDAVEITLGVPLLRALFDLQVGMAELVEVAPDLVRRAMQSNVRVWASSPVTLYALRFDDSQPAALNEKLREAFSLSLDRNTMAGVLLQKQAEPAAALLPQWLSGYAFLFHAEMDLERAKQLRASLPANVAGASAPLKLQTDTAGDLAQLLTERVAVNARQAGLSVLASNRAAAHHLNAHTPGHADLHLFMWRYGSLSPREELQALAAAMRVDAAEEDGLADAERRYAWERKLLEERKLMPLVILPDYAGLAPNVRDWQPSPWGEWHLADVWLEPGATQVGSGEKAAPAITPSPGARP
jgi:MarR-like DNA-binding transcriptional regulator SgrR of sgrS sRNA